MNKKSPRDNNAAKRFARLAAVQALYQIELTGRDAADVIRDLCDQPRNLLPEDAAPSDVDQELFGDIVSGVNRNTAPLDEMIAGAIDLKFSAKRLEVLLRAILRAGAYELHHHGSVPTGVIVNDYVDVTHSFFNAREPGLVNAMLDQLAKTLRQ